MRRVDLMLSQQCNTNCIFCYLHGIKKSDYDFSFDKIKETLENGAAKGYKEVYISGGEPTLNNKLPEIIAYAKKLGFQDIKIMTNGLRMSYPNFLKKLIGCGLNQLAFSLHGSDAKTHDFHTNYKGSFELSEKAIDNALTYKDKLKIEVNSVITKYNINKIIIDSVGVLNDSLSLIFLVDSYEKIYKSKMYNSLNENYFSSVPLQILNWLNLSGSWLFMM